MAHESEWLALCEEHNRKIARNPSAKFSRFSVENPELKQAVEHKKLKDYGGDKFFALDQENFVRVFTVLLNAEEIHTDIEMRRHDQHEVRVKKDKKSKSKDKKSATQNDEPLFTYCLEGLSKGQPKLVPGDYVILDNGYEEPERFIIEEIEGDEIKFKMARHSNRKIEGVDWSISFHSSAIPYDRCTQNLRMIEGWSMLKHMLFMGGRQKTTSTSKANPSPDSSQTQNESGSSGQQVLAAKIDPNQKARLKFIEDRLDKCNDRQKQAIKSIMRAECRPNLYILFGPPGTGKTFTLIEAIGQIFQRSEFARVLVCANSNNCVDDLAKKLLESGCIKSRQLVRYCSRVYYNSLLDKADLPVPEFFTDEPWKTFDKRVVLATNMMSFKLSQKFDFVFVDEAGHAHIPESLLPCSRVKDDGCFVLAGDPKQLGPVLHSREACELGLGESLLERLFSQHIYGKHQGKYDERYITKLIDAYRCDERILGLCDRLFYKGELNCLGKTPPAILQMVGATKPLVFMQVNGQEMTPRRSTSRQNDLEAEICIDKLFMLYKKGIKPDQIGIIAFYGLQKALIIEKFEQRLKKEARGLNKAFKSQQAPAQPAPVGKKAKSRQITLVKSSDGNETVSYYLKQMKLFCQNLLGQSKQTSSKSDQYEQFDWHCKIDTVDAFQGNEREVIIISTTRTPSGSDSNTIRGPGFLTDPKRFNVAISRAKWLVLVVGHQAVLNSCKVWKRFQQEAQVMYNVQRER